jgi:ribose/xylose/arabinose/galactoside ABC-type transport system permease subunit
MDWYKIYKKYGLFIILILFIIVFTALNRQFFTVGNLMNILRQISMFGIVIVGYTMVMVGGGCDMSVGGELALCGMFAAQLTVNMGVPVGPAFLLTLLLGAVFGLINGILMTKFNIMPLVVTLGTMLIFQGASYLISGGVAIFGLSDSFKWIGQGSVGPFPVPVILLIIIAVIGYIVLHKTYFGRQLYAMGGNPEAAILAGINIKKYRIVSFVVTGVLAALAGIIMTARTGSAQPSAGSSYPFDCMTAAVLGGVSFAGGAGSMLGAMMGVVIIGVMNNGLQLIGMDSNMISCVKGVVLLIAIGIDSMQRVQKKKKA